jgi:ribosomal protein S18 acetylase RimI-like enzyme
LNRVCFPVQYKDQFYKDVLAQKSDEISKFAYVNGFVVGSVCCRVEPLDPTAAGGDSGRMRLYIMTFGVLAAYRGHGIGTKLMESIMTFWKENQVDGSDNKDEAQHALNEKNKSKFQKAMKNVDEISLHVQTSNEDAIKFYTARFGFVKGELVKNYYKRIDPPDCYIVYRNLR